MLNKKSQLLNRLKKSTSHSVDYSVLNFMLVSLAGIVFFPLYYFVWTYLSPQPYENLSLRIFGALLFVPILFNNRYPKRLKKYLALYWLFVITYTLPFFFSYMMLMNQGVIAWGMSCVAAIYILFLIIEDWVLVNILYAVGVTAAIVAYSLSTDNQTLPENLSMHISIYVFALITGSIFNHRTEQVRRERSLVMASIGQGVAHELRTPLQSIQSAVSGLSRYLPSLMAGYKAANESGLHVPTIRKAHIDTLGSLLERVDNEIIYAQGIIDMLLINSGKNKIDNSHFVLLSIEHCTQLAFERYPFPTTEDREKVSIHSDGDFSFIGSEVLYSHVIFNLMKNALWFINEKGSGKITIQIDPEKRCVKFRDNSTGIPAEITPYIFDQFFSTRAAGNGAGLGLPFCQLAMKSFNGHIEVNSQYGEFTEFTMYF